MTNDARNEPQWGKDARSFMKAHVRYYIDGDSVISTETLRAVLERFFELLAVRSETAPQTEHPQANEIRHAIRFVAFEEAAAKCDALVKRMAAHTDQAGNVTGPDFFFGEIAAVEEAAGLIRALKNAAPLATDSPRVSGEESPRVFRPAGAAPDTRTETAPLKGGAKTAAEEAHYLEERWRKP